MTYTIQVKAFVISVILLSGSLLVFSQKKKEIPESNYISQPNRIEFDMLDSDVEYTIVSGEEKGLLVVIETNSRGGDGYNWLFHFMDTTLNVKWTKLLSIDYESGFRGYDYYDGKFYLLFNKSRYKNEELIVYVFDAETSDFGKIEISTVFPIQLSEFEVLGNSILLGGYVNLRPVMISYDIREKKPRVLPGFYGNSNDILNLVTDDNADVFTVVLTEQMRNKRNSIRAKTFTSDGILVQDNMVQPGDKKNLIDGASTMFFGGFQYLVGTYSKRSSLYSKGLYLSKFVNGRQQFIKYYGYSDLNNFFGYMKEKRESRIKARIKRKKAKGKRPNFSYQLLVHDIIERNGTYVLIAEAYYTRYSGYASSMVPYSSGYGYNYPRNYSPGFLGYKYTHAIVVAFDQAGNIIWDNSFGIDDVTTYSLDEFVNVNTYDDKIVLMYLDENEIRSKVIKGNEIFEGKTINPVRLTYEYDKVKNRDPDVEGLEDWYDNTLYAFGEQRIYNEVKESGEAYRKIFYINKIEYHLESNPN